MVWHSTSQYLFLCVSVWKPCAPACTNVWVTMHLAKRCTSVLPRGLRHGLRDRRHCPRGCPPRPKLSLRSASPSRRPGPLLCGASSSGEKWFQSEVHHWFAPKSKSMRSMSTILAAQRKSKCSRKGSMMHDVNEVWRAQEPLGGGRGSGAADGEGVQWLPKPAAGAPGNTVLISFLGVVRWSNRTQPCHGTWGGGADRSVYMPLCPPPPPRKTIGAPIEGLTQQSKQPRLKPPRYPKFRRPIFGYIRFPAFFHPDGKVCGLHKKGENGIGEYGYLVAFSSIFFPLPPISRHFSAICKGCSMQFQS